MMIEGILAKRLIICSNIPFNGSLLSTGIFFQHGHVLEIFRAIKRHKYGGEHAEQTAEQHRSARYGEGGDDHGRDAENIAELIFAVPGLVFPGRLPARPEYEIENAHFPESGNTAVEHENDYRKYREYGKRRTEAERHLCRVFFCNSVL